LKQQDSVLAKILAKISGDELLNILVLAWLVALSSVYKVTIVVGGGSEINKESHLAKFKVWVFRLLGRPTPVRGTGPAERALATKTLRRQRERLRRKLKRLGANMANIRFRIPVVRIDDEEEAQVNGDDFVKIAHNTGFDGLFLVTTDERATDKRARVEHPDTPRIRVLTATSLPNPEEMEQLLHELGERHKAILVPIDEEATAGA